MKILVINFAASEGGALSILQDFYESINENDKDNEWYFLLSDRYLEETKNIKVIVDPSLKKWSKRIFFDLFLHKSLLKEIQPDVIFSMQNTSLFSLKIPQILYLHQSLPFQKEKKYSFFKKEERKFAVYQFIIGNFIKYSLKYTNKIVVQTVWMRKAVENTKYGRNKAIAVQPPIPIEKNNTEVILTYRDFFYPTSDAPYKNISLIEDACKIVNRTNPNIDINVDITIDREIPSSSITSIGKIPRSEVVNRYQKSILIFPSFIETFGMPLAEAKAMGTIILAADTEFSREILEGYENAYFFNHTDSNQLAELMVQCAMKDITLSNATSLKTNSTSDGWDTVQQEIFTLLNN